jgi:hypothetical protein
MSAEPSKSTGAGKFTRTDRTDGPTADERADQGTQARGDTFTHLITILSVSSGMVGVCLTAIGLIGIKTALSTTETVVDDLLALGSILFMATAVLSFLGLRTSIGTRRNFARVLDTLFVVSLVLVVLATALLTWVLV